MNQQTKDCITRMKTVRVSHTTDFLTLFHRAEYVLRHVATSSKNGLGAARRGDVKDEHVT